MPTKITVVVENHVKEGSNLRSEHGLSFWIETPHGIVLFDTGQTEDVLFHNMEMLGLNPEDVDALVLSHSHYDHTGGLETILAKNHGLPLIAHADLFRSRYSLRNGEYKSIGMVIPEQELAERVKLTLSDEPVEVLPGLWTTGGIHERPEPVGGSDHLFSDGESGMQPDQYKDDLSLVLKTADGLVLICGCCHAGILNTLFHVKKRFDGPITTVIGGMHLKAASDAYLVHVVQVLSVDFPGLMIFPNHCTGDNAIQKLTDVFGDRVSLFSVGSTLQFAE
jgi:7,8-dihydropterin-6-yl-methyl-4-(beta-D-ribofuranosyl)aminobenzene 5'-phosphate synthase